MSVATKMIKKQVYLDEESVAALKRIALQFKMSDSEVVRQSLKWVDEDRSRSLREADDPWDEIIGCISGLPPGNYSQDVDRYIYG